MVNVEQQAGPHEHLCNDASDLIWGAEAIGREINRSARQTFYLLEQGLIPGRKIGNQWTSTRRQLRQHVAGEAQG